MIYNFDACDTYHIDLTTLDSTIVCCPWTPITYFRHLADGRVLKVSYVCRLLKLSNWLLDVLQYEVIPYTVSRVLCASDQCPHNTKTWNTSKFILKQFSENKCHLLAMMNKGFQRDLMYRALKVLSCITSLVPNSDAETSTTNLSLITWWHYVCIYIYIYIYVFRRLPRSECPLTARRHRWSIGITSVMDKVIMKAGNIATLKIVNISVTDCTFVTTLLRAPTSVAVLQRMLIESTSMRDQWHFKHAQAMHHAFASVGRVV